jgi:hypothetical protein
MVLTRERWARWKAATLAFGALYHPWLVNTEAGQIRATPPDGLALGQLAQPRLATWRLGGAGQSRLAAGAGARSGAWARPTGKCCNRRRST